MDLKTWTDEHTDGRTDRRTDRQTDRRTDEQTSHSDASISIMHDLIVAA